MKALITRPQPDAEKFAALCRREGVDPIVAPLMSVAFLSGWEIPGDAGALAFTSANGVRAFVRASRVRNLTAFCVGEVTAEAAADAAFSVVHAAGGDVESLAALIGDNAADISGQVVHIAGNRRAGDLIKALRQRGISASQVVAYETQDAEALPQLAQSAISSGRALTVTFFSPRTAQLFLSLVEAANMTEALTRCRAVCLSDAVAEAAARASWRIVDTAPARNAAAMVAILKTGA